MSCMYGRRCLLAKALLTGTMTLPEAGNGCIPGDNLTQITQPKRSLFDAIRAVCNHRSFTIALKQALLFLLFARPRSHQSAMEGINAITFSIYGEISGNHGGCMHDGAIPDA